MAHDYVSTWLLSPFVSSSVSHFVHKGALLSGSQLP